jgi:hypothetical protein
MPTSPKRSILLRIMIFSIRIPCSSATAQRFGGTYRLLLLGKIVSRGRSVRTATCFLLEILFDPEDGVICSSETLGSFITAWLYNPGDRTLHSHRREKLKSNISSSGFPTNNAHTFIPIALQAACVLFLRTSEGTQ